MDSPNQPEKNPAEEAKKLMGLMNDHEKFMVNEDLNEKNKNIPPEPVKVLAPDNLPQPSPLDNLIHESKRRNEKIPHGGINLKPNTYDKIMAILKDGGMDSMSQVKAIEKIKEVINEEVLTTQREIIEEEAEIEKEKSTGFNE